MSADLPFQVKVRRFMRKIPNAESREARLCVSLYL
jgi:hypothetical protein